MPAIYLAQSTLDRELKYIGKTNRTLEERRKEHEDAASNRDPSLFHVQLLRKGLDNWQWRLLEEDIAEKDIFEREKFWIREFSARSIGLLNTSSNSKKEKEDKNIDLLARSLGGKNVWKNANAKKWLILSNKLRPLMDTEKNIKFDSLVDAERKTNETKGAIKKSCDTGIPTLKGNRYAWLDAEDTAKLTPNHIQRVLREKRVKSITTGEIYKDLNEAAKDVAVKKTESIRMACLGRYKTVKRQIFCFLDNDGKEILTETHKRYYLELEKKSKTGFVAYRIEDKNLEKPYQFDSIKELIESIKKSSGEHLSYAHILDICKGKRQHDKGWRVAYFDKEEGVPILKDSHLKQIRKNIRRVICLNDNKTFDNCMLAAKFYGLISSQVGACCSGVLKSTGGRSLGSKYKFAYLSKTGKPELTAKHSESDSWLGTKIFCPELGKEFRSVAEFCKETGIPGKRVRKHLKNPNINLGGLNVIQLK